MAAVQAHDLPASVEKTVSCPAPVAPGRRAVLLTRRYVLAPGSPASTAFTAPAPSPKAKMCQPPLTLLPMASMADGSPVAGYFEPHVINSAGNHVCRPGFTSPSPDSSPHTAPEQILDMLLFDPERRSGPLRRRANQAVGQGGAARDAASATAEGRSITGPLCFRRQPQALHSPRTRRALARTKHAETVMTGACRDAVSLLA